MEDNVKNTDGSKFRSRKAMCCLILAAGITAITGCGEETVAISRVSCVDESTLQGSSGNFVCVYRAHGQNSTLMDEASGEEIPMSEVSSGGDSMSAASGEGDPMSEASGEEIPMSVTAAGDFPMSAVVQSERSTDPVMGSVPYFRDDAGKRIQMVGGYLYGYWNDRLCRYDPETLDETVLYEAASSQNGDFCVWGDYVYFMVVPNVNAVGKLHGCLYRVKCDGSEEAVCLANVAMPAQRSGGQYYQYYRLDTYEDVLYLLQQWEDDENLYFHLDQDGSIERIAESETLYGQLPEGDFKRWRNNTMLTLPYAMRNYGYAFMYDDKDNPVRIDLDSQQVEIMDVLRDYGIRTVTNDAVIVCKDNVWYRISLDDMEDIREIGMFSNDFLEYASWDEKGLYFTSLSKDESVRVYLLDWEGEEDVLRYGFTRMQYSPIEYFDADHYYYLAESKGNSVVRRLELTGDEDAEDVAVYREDPYWEAVSEECYDLCWTDAHVDASIDYSITKIFFQDDTGAFGKINDFMDHLYMQDIAIVENFKETVREEDEEYWEKWGADREEATDTYEIVYMDENYVGIADYWYWYQWGAAHGMHGIIYYMFDRNTGERVSITDVLGRSPEEVCEIIAPYVEAAAVWGTDDEGWEDMILDEGRFFLSEEGIGIHFDVYEIGSYAAGDQEIIVPYRIFDPAEG